MKQPNPKYKLAVWVSGSGTLLERMIADKRDISYVVAEKACRGLEIAEAAGIETILIDRQEYGWKPGVYWQDDPMKGVYSKARQAFSEAIAASMAKAGVNLIAMAGFMTVLAPNFFETYEGLILNIHPALLPAFKGESAVEDALNYGVKIIGSTIHIATAKLDDGPIIEQDSIRVQADDTAESLHERLKAEVERPMYSRVIGVIMEQGIEALLWKK